MPLTGIVPIDTKYRSDDVAIVPKVGYTNGRNEVQNDVYIRKTGRREMEHFR